MGNLSLLTNFQKLSTDSITVTTVHFAKCVMLVLIKVV